MNPSMSGTIQRLMSTFLTLFLIISLIAAYIQITNQAFYNGPTLAHGAFDPRRCPPVDAPVRGTIYDRNGVKLAWSEPDSNAPCGYARKYADPTLAPLIGYFSNKYGTSGLENTFNDELAGNRQAGDLQDVVNQETNNILHRPRYGQDIYLSIDENLQKAANDYYDKSALYNRPGETNGVCQAAGSNPPGSLIASDPRTGEVLAMVSRPYYDASKIDQPGYFQQLQADPGHPLFNHATQGLYDPGSTFKTVTMVAGLDSGQVSLSTPYTYDEATNYVVNGEPIRWVDYLDNGVWKGIQFPLTLAQGYAYSDNVIYARAAVKMGKDTWLDYVRRFGIQTPGVDVAPVGFDGPYSQSSAFQKPVTTSTFSPNLLAESGFGQGQLLISPLTMSEVSGAVANDGVLIVPHSVLAVVPHASGVPPITQQGTAYTGAPIFHPETARLVRQAMADVMNYGTGYAGLFRNGRHPNQSDVHEGGKTGTAQLEQGNPNTWWISLAPDDVFPNAGPAKMTVVVSKERSGEGACQVFVAEDVYQYAIDHHIGPYK